MKPNISTNSIHIGVALRKQPLFPDVMSRNVHEIVQGPCQYGCMGARNYNYQYFLKKTYVSNGSLQQIQSLVNFHQIHTYVFFRKLGRFKLKMFFIRATNLCSFSKLVTQKKISTHCFEFLTYTLYWVPQNMYQIEKNHYVALYCRINQFGHSFL